MSDTRCVFDLTPYTGARSSEYRVVRVARQDVTRRFVIMVVAGVPISVILGAITAPLLDLWALAVGVAAEVLFLFAFYWISPFGLRQQQWRKWRAKLTSHNGKVLNSGRIVDQRFDDVRRFEPSILCRPESAPEAFSHEAVVSTPRTPRRSSERGHVSLGDRLPEAERHIPDFVPGTWGRRLLAPTRRGSR